MITVYLSRRRMLVKGHDRKWICGVMTFLVQACYGWTADTRFVSESGLSEVALPTGEVGRFVRWAVRTLAREMPKQLRVRNASWTRVRSRRVRRK